MSGPKTAGEREKALRRRIHSLEQQLAVKNQILDTTKLQVLKESFPDLPQLFTLLRKAHDAASPLKSPAGDGRGNGMPSPLESGADSRRDRDRLSDLNRRIRFLVEYAEDQLGARGPLEEKPPQCWNPNCPAFAVFQSFGAGDGDVCGSCGSAWIEFREPKDRTVNRCWQRICQGYGKSNQCQHVA